MYELLLVSQSPRRRQILLDAGFLFRVDIVKTSEIIEENVNFALAIASVARAKVETYLGVHKHMKSQEVLLLSADTMVISEGRALGKPKNSTEAEHFLASLSGKTHSVISGICILNLKTGEVFEGADTTEVEFRELTLSEIRNYIATGEPFDKAGAYAIQGGGRQFVKNVEGSILNVIGFPLELFEKVLAEKGWHVARHSVT